MITAILGADLHPLIYYLEAATYFIYILCMLFRVSLCKDDQPKNDPSIVQTVQCSSGLCVQLETSQICVIPHGEPFNKNGESAAAVLNAQSKDCYIFIRHTMRTLSQYTHQFVRAILRAGGIGALGINSRAVGSSIVVATSF